MLYLLPVPVWKRGRVLITQPRPPTPPPPAAGEAAVSDGAVGTAAVSDNFAG